MAGPKGKLPEHVATQIANPAPKGGERRTAALPHAPVPTAGPHARTMMFDPYAQRPRSPMPTVMTAPQTASRPSPPPRGGAGRWIGGPILAIVVGAATVWIAGLVNAASLPPQKPHGRLRLSSDPEGATVLVDGKVQTRPTPTVIEGDVGATLRVGFKLDGYLDKEADVFVGDGERPFRAKLEKREQVEVPPPEPPPVAPPSPTPKEPRAKKTPRERTVSERVEQPVATPPPIASAGSGTVSVHVRPWAIVYIDGAKIHQTPVDGQSVAAGLHVVELVNDGIRKKEKVTLEVRANGHEEIRRDWEK
jgi:hypothetical protein